MNRTKESAVTMVHRLLRAQVQPGDVVIDATVGNGWDTCMLSELVGASGTVFGFDIQQGALDAARTRLAPNMQHVQLHLAGHEMMSELVDKQYHGRVRAVTFNLGYLPGGDKSITTTVPTTVAALRQALDIIMPGGIITIVCYSHPEGRAELESIESLLAHLSQDRFSSLKTQFVNQQGNPPVVFAVYAALYDRTIS